MYVDKLIKKEKDIKRLKKQAQEYELKQHQLYQELQTKQTEVDMLTNQIDLSEIVSEQNFNLTNHPISNTDLLEVVEILANDIGYQLGYKSNEELGSGKYFIRQI